MDLSGASWAGGPGGVLGYITSTAVQRLLLPRILHIQAFCITCDTFASAKRRSFGEESEGVEPGVRPTLRNKAPPSRKVVSSLTSH